MAMAEATETLFDTHAHVRALTGAGMPEAQAEAVVRLQVDVLQRHIVTKADAAAIRRDIADLRTWSEGEFSSLRTWSEAEFRSLRTWTESEFRAVRSEIADLRTWTEAEFRAMRSEIASLRTWTESEFAKVGEAIDTSAAKTTTRIVLWVSGINIAIAALAVAAIKIL